MPDDQRETSVLSWIWILTIVEGLKWILQNTQGKIVEISLVPRPSTPPVLFFWGSKADFYKPVTRFMCGQLVLRLLYVFPHLLVCVSPAITCTSHTVLPGEFYFCRLQTPAWVVVWVVQHRYGFEILRSRRMPTEPLTNWVWLPGELLGGLEYSKPRLVF